MRDVLLRKTCFGQHNFSLKSVSDETCHFQAAVKGSKILQQAINVPTEIPAIFYLNIQ